MLEFPTGTRENWRELSAHLRPYFWPAGCLKHMYSLIGWVFGFQEEHYSKAHVGNTAVLQVCSPAWQGSLPSISIKDQKRICYSFGWEKDSSTAHVVVRHCSERMFLNIENQCSWNCFPVFELFSVDPCVEYWSYHLITVVKDSVFCGYNWGRLNSYVLWILWLNYAIFVAIFVGSNFCFSTCSFPATYLLSYPPQMVLTCLWRRNSYLIPAIFPFSFLLMC